MSLRVAVDFGTSSTCVVASINGREPQIVVVDGQPLMSSAVYAAADGTVFVGQEAERQAAVDPSRYEPNPKRRIDEGELLLGDTVIGVLDAVHAVLRRAVTEARGLAGGAEVDLLVLTHPADWGAVRTRLLRQAAGRLAHEVALVPEPVAAAVFHAATYAPAEVTRDRTVEFSGRPGDTLAVLDVGGGTVDVSVVRRSPAAGPVARRGGFEVLATRGDPSFGGADIDQVLLEHVGSLVSKADPEAWLGLVGGRAMAERRRRRVLRQDVRGAKETLSRHAYTDVPMPPPFADAHVTREDLERLVAPQLGRAVELTSAAIEEAGLRPQQLTGIFLVGGSSRIPMVSRLVHERTGVVPTTLDQPETVVARGALRAVLVEADRTGALAGSSPARPGLPRPVGEQRTQVVGPADANRPPRQAPPRRMPPPPRQPVTPAPARPMPPPIAAPAHPAHSPPTGRGKKVPWLVAGAVVVLAAAVTGGFLFFGGEKGKTFAQYDYQFVAPEDWTQTGDNVAARQVVVKPADALDADDLVVVQEYLLGYDGVTERDRFVGELRQKVADKGTTHSDFNPGTSYAGKDVISYREKAGSLVISWYVVAKGDVEVAVGCQVADGQARVDGACQQIVRTLEITK
ncbi:type VII secretion-associated protein [Amycolatopsis antarctica]|uniref:Type VII secretion-associated protein n=1 Tax=Amycolatopsis antarctica TaxID=1854586 RepID=A0A263D8S9_9PSEU|nr:type VII secretion-associated protein [Amycolatopsis antarctica]OZM74912.1 type VII secretion-associated protein [Amycolatopsis antarctica]